jgi:hypothetical protein
VIHGDFVDDPSSGPTTLFLREIYERMITNVIDPEQKLKTSGPPALRSCIAGTAIDGR